MFGAIPFGSFRAAVWCCPSMLFVVRFRFRLHRLHSIRFARFRCIGFTSFRTSYRLLGWVTFVHHSVGKHVRSLLALGYDALEYFIFYILLNTLGWSHTLTNTLYSRSFLRKLESTRARTSGQTVYVNLHLCLALARPVCLKLGTCISRLLHAFHFMHFARFYCARYMHLWHAFLTCAELQESTSAAVLLSAFRVEFSPPPPHSATCACRVVVLPLHAFRCSIPVPIASFAFHSVCTVSMHRLYIFSNFVSFAGVGHVCAPFGRKTCPLAACIRI